MTLLGPVRTLSKIVISLSPSLLLTTPFSRSLSLSLSLWEKLLALGIVCEEVFNECTFGAQQLSLSYTHTHMCVRVCVTRKTPEHQILLNITWKTSDLQIDMSLV